MEQHDVTNLETCPHCQSRQLLISDDVHDANGDISFVCFDCGETFSVSFDESFNTERKDLL